MSAALLAVQSLAHRFRLKDGRAVRAIDGVDLSVESGEILGIVGESGCGKSTLGKTLIGVLRADDGTVTFEGAPIQNLEGRSLRAVRSRLQYVYQDASAALDPRWTIGRSLDETLVIHTALSRPQRAARVRETLAAVGLHEDQLSLYPHEISGGQQRRVGLARVLVLYPRLLILDEPTSGLDVSVQATILKLLVALWKQYGLTLLFISHDLAVVRSICTRVAVMYLGRIVETGPTAELFASPRHPYTRSLLAAVPLPGGRRVIDEAWLEGEPPDPLDIPSGCRFRNRCPMAQPLCARWRQATTPPVISPDRKGIRSMPAPAKKITMDDLEAFAIGAWILGTGGGGDPYFSLLEARQHWGAGRSVELIDPLSLDDDDAIACIGQMGAPIAMQEKMVDGPLIARTITMMEEHIGKKFKAIMMWEVGGNNGFQPFLAGSLLGLPVVDCDAMGRAFPQADMTTFAIRDLPAYPWTMIDIRDNSVILTSAVDWTWMEKMTRKVCTVWGSLAATCKAPRTGRDAKESSCLHTATKAIRIGRAVQAARRTHEDPVEAVVKSEQGLLVFRGKVTDVLRRATEGWLRGTVVMEGLDEHRGETFRVDFQNEWSIGWLNDEVKVTVPDLICLMDTVSGEAIGTETVRYGQRVSVIALPAPAILMSPKGLKHVGPRAFGYDIDFKSIFPESVR